MKLTIKELEEIERNNNALRVNSKVGGDYALEYVCLALREAWKALDEIRIKARVSEGIRFTALCALPSDWRPDEKKKV